MTQLLTCFETNINFNIESIFRPFLLSNNSLLLIILLLKRRVNQLLFYILFLDYF
jgi:hypothetical protein